MSNLPSNQMCVCAHQRVTWRTEEIEKGVLGWWACTECQTVFVPMKSYEASLDVVNRLNAAEIERLRAALEEVEVDAAQRQRYYDFRKYMNHINGCKGGGDQSCACGKASTAWNLDELIDGGEAAYKVLRLADETDGGR